MFAEGLLQALRALLQRSSLPYQGSRSHLRRHAPPLPHRGPTDELCPIVAPQMKQSWVLAPQCRKLSLGRQKDVAAACHRQC